MNKSSKKSLLEKIIAKEAPWNGENLPPEQRGEVWDARNIIELLDSICRGYPLGVIIYREAKDGDLVKSDGQELQEAEKGARLIYDGQQRIHTLQKIFDDEGFCLLMGKTHRYSGRIERCKVYVDISLFGNILEDEQKKKKENKFPRFKNRKGETGAYPFEIFPESVLKDSYLGENHEIKDEKKGEVKKFIGQRRTEWAHPEDHKWISLPRLMKGSSDDLSKVKDYIEGKCNRELIKELCISDIKTDDLEHLYLRINRTGKPVSGEEQYFAALQNEFEKKNVDYILKRVMDGIKKNITHFENNFNKFDILRIIVNICHNIEEWEKGTIKWKDQPKYIGLELKNCTEEQRDKIKNNIYEIINSGKIEEAIKDVIKGCGEHF